MNDDPIVIVGAARTPIGSFQGQLSSFSAIELGTHAIRAVLERTQLDPVHLDEVLMGCVISAGLGQAPARQASLGAQIPQSVGCTTLNKVCGSSMKAVMLACDTIKAQTNTIVLAGGMESMTNAPYLLPHAREGYRIAHHTLIDSMFLDGLEDAYSSRQLMGVFAEKTAKHYGFSREDQDNFAIESLTRANTARENAWLLSDVEIAPIEIPQKNSGSIVMEHDEQPLRSQLEKIPKLKPAFAEKGTVTAANSSSISDGAAALLLMPLSEANKRQLKPLAKILGYVSHAQEPEWFTTAPTKAIEKLLTKLNWDTTTPDLWEINEAFAAVAMGAQQELKIPRDKLNIHGGACALGHPLGATGARLVTTLLGALTQQQLSLGIAALCIGGGEATALALERITTP